jgi:hypothetical protein
MCLFSLVWGRWDEMNHPWTTLQGREVLWERGASQEHQDSWPPGRQFTVPCNAPDTDYSWGKIEKEIYFRWRIRSDFFYKHLFWKAGGEKSVENGCVGRSPITQVHWFTCVSQLWFGTAKGKSKTSLRKKHVGRSLEGQGTGHQSNEVWQHRWGKGQNLNTLSHSYQLG